MYLIIAHSTHYAPMALALAVVAKQNKPSYMATAKKHRGVHTTLCAQMFSQSLSIPSTASKHHPRLTLIQEETLIEHISNLIDRGIPPTSRIIRNLAEEIIEGPIGKNWIGDFVRRYQERLESLHLRNIDS